jgi:alkylhydroperoxidase family enzyme
MRRSKLDRKTSERISIAVQAQPGLRPVPPVARRRRRSLAVSEDEIALAHAGISADDALTAIITLGLQVYTEPASITDEQIQELRAYGYSDREIADVVGIVALNLLTGAFNLLAGLTPGRQAESQDA